MNLNEAYSVLGVSKSSSPEELKKKFRELTKKHHPDIDKSTGAEDRFKKINEAYQVASTGESTDQHDKYQKQTYNQSRAGFGGFDISDLFNQHQTKQRQVSHIQLDSVISFKDSIFGVKQEFKINREAKCESCNGEGSFKKNNGCVQCKGSGQITIQQGHTIMVMVCNKCGGKASYDECKPCNSSGVIEKQATISVNIPGGIQSDNVIRLSGMGNYAGNFGFMEQSSDVFIKIKVTPLDGFTLKERDVHTNLNISLLEAIEGCEKIIPTLLGSQLIEIKPKSKNADFIKLPKLGVDNQGSQIVNIFVEYPKDIAKLTKLLKKNK